MKQAVAYLRVSTDGQDTKSQRSKIEEYAEANGYEVEQWFVDEALSGTLDDRPQLLALKEWVPKNDGKSILMVGLDRLARDFTIYADFSSLFLSHNVHAVYLNCPTIGEPSIDTLLQNILAAFAAYEKDVIRDRMQRGKNYKLKNGIIAAGGPPLFGYKYRVEYYPNGKKDKFYEINEEEAETVRLMFRMLLSEKWKVQGIGRELTRLQVRTRSGTTRWAPSSTRSLLCNTTYMGEYRYGKTKMSGVGKNRHEIPRAYEEQLVVKVPAIISEDDFNRAQEILKRLGQGLGGRQRKKNNFLLSGLMRCGKCNFLYSGGGHKSGKNIHSYYRCNSINKYNEKGEHHSCGNATLKTGVADGAVWNALAEILIDPDKIKNGVDTAKRESEIEGMYDDLITLVNVQDRIEEEKKRLVSGFAKGILTEEEVREYRKDLSEREKVTSDKMTEINMQVNSAMWNLGDIEFGPAKTRKEVDGYSYDKKLELVKTYVSEVRVLPTEPTKLEIVFRLPIKPAKTVVTLDNLPPNQE
ncbi:MAG TPA: recombinase family protein [Spirochaetia bacterium]|nr:recombinase family protein [Spirochaetia bacterium]